MPRYASCPNVLSTVVVISSFIITTTLTVGSAIPLVQDGQQNNTFLDGWRWGTFGMKPMPFTPREVYHGDSPTATSHLQSTSNITNSSDGHGEGIHVASWNWQYVRQPFIYTAFLVIAGLCKVGFHYANYLSTILPESCLLILLGTIIGAIIYYTGMESELPHFESRAFFLFFLPPIMLESAYSLHDRAFADNIGTILLYAVVGTLISCFTIGPTLYGLAVGGAMGQIDLPVVQALLFSALISAVDPVAVLAIFNEVGVNKDLYFLVFGESLLNDAVTVVLYNMMVTFTTMKVIPFSQIMLGIAAFICSSLGGLTIGAIYGVLTSLITKYTEKVRVVEPLAFLGMAYLAYLTAEMVHFSGIISIIGCGLVQMQYAKNNISMKSYTTIKYFSKMLSATSDCIIFLFLGMVLINDEHEWQTGFVLWSVVLCLIYRFLSVFFLTFLANRFYRNQKIGFREQFIMAYGGLRGAVCFSLVIMLNQATVPLKQLFVTTTLVIIFFTVFFQGGTIKWLVKCFEIQMADKETETITRQINVAVIDNVMAGVEQIIGRYGDFQLKLKVDYYDEKYIKRWLQRSQSDLHNFCKVYEKLAIEDHYAHLYGPATAIEDCKKLSLYSYLDYQYRKEDEIMVEDSYQGIDQQMEELNEAPTVFVPLPKTPKTPKTPKETPPKSPKWSDSFSPRTSSEEDRLSSSLRKAISENPYNKFHQKFNPNLVNDDEQELPTQLRRRRLRSRRLTMTAMSPTISQHSSNSDVSDEGVQLRNKNIKRQPSTDQSNRVNFWKSRAQQRRLTMCNFQRAKTIDASVKGHPLNNVSADFPGLDPGNRPHSTGDLEMRNLPLSTINEMENGGPIAKSSSGIGTIAENIIRPWSEPGASISTPEETRPLMTAEAPIASSHQQLPPPPQHQPQQPAIPPRRKHLLSKSTPVDIDEDEDDDAFERP
ncbi:hypothetical protein CHUAL_001243 [Chamberlinius hualienensis]